MDIQYNICLCCVVLCCVYIVTSECYSETTNQPSLVKKKVAVTKLARADISRESSYNLQCHSMDSLTD